MRPVAIANRHPKLRLNRAAVSRAVHVLDARHAALATRRSALGNTAELSIVFLTDEALAKLHADFLDDPTTTDVITFESDAAHGSAGEICVSVDTAARYASEHGRDFAEELTLYLVHGWLHLAGYDDLRPDKKRVMRRAEARAMALLREADAVPRFALKQRQGRSGR
jgi:probable rRNA maturation factor